jgi:ADP-ribosylglycohydrolase
MTRPADHADRMRRALVSLEGLSVGDAFGEKFFVHPSVLAGLFEQRAAPAPPWGYTDDTEMALAIVEVLHRHGAVEQDDLAAVFGRRYAAAPNRGYGGTAHTILQSIAVGSSWRDISPKVFGGQGSMGNGGAMRVAPLGAYFMDDLAAVEREARASAEVTHAHPEGQAGAIAVALVAAYAAQIGQGTFAGRAGKDLLEAAREAAGEEASRRYLERALAVPLDANVADAARTLGTGQQVLAWDTVPFSLWCAARHASDYEAALWATVSGLGDRDTTCAIVGGIVALSAGEASIPAAWRAAREPLGIDLTPA